MTPQSSAREDDISSKLIKYCKDEIGDLLTDLINKSLNKEMFPSSKISLSLPYI